MCLHNKKINFGKNIQKLEKLEKSFYFTVKIAVFPSLLGNKKSGSLGPKLPKLGE